MTHPRVTTPVSGRKRWYLAITALIGVALLGWTIVSVGPRALASQLRTIAPVLPVLLVLAAVRFWLQAAGWRLALPRDHRPAWGEAFPAVVAGEAAAYFAWGAVSREPLKASLVGQRVSRSVALKGAVVERFFYSLVAAALIVGAIGLAAVRFHFIGRFLTGLAVGSAAVLALGRYAKGLAVGERRWSIVAAIVGLGVAQEVSNLVEAYLILWWLGASPTIAAVVVLEGISRLMNAAGQFIPGKLGVAEAATTALADGLRLGSVHGLGLAVARRVRALLWGAVGIALVGLHAASAKQTGGASPIDAVAA